MSVRAVILALTLAACGSKHEAKTHQVEIRAMQFVPSALEVTVGDTIVWTNEDYVPHTVTSANPSPTAFDSKQMGAKARWEYKVTAAGNYAYGCTFHPTMHGTFVAK